MYLLVPIKCNKVVMSSFTGGGFGDNPKYVALEMLKRGGYDIVWLVNTKKYIDFSVFPKEIRTVEYYSRKARWELATAKYWVGSEVTVLPIPKKKRQILVMTWHGVFGIKKGIGVANFIPNGWIEITKKYAKVANYYVSACKEDDKMYRESLAYDGKILDIGSPRCDILYEAAARIKFREQLGLGKDDKVIMYAPTFRFHRDLDVYNLDYSKVRSAFATYFKVQDVKMLVRLHPDIYTKFEKLSVPAFVRDVSKYPDMQELLCAIDVLITDYSSSPFDFIVTRRPIFLYVHDYEDYNAHEFGLKRMPEELPFEYGYSNEELCQKIKAFDYDAYRQRIEKFLADNEFYGDGHTSKMLVDIMEQVGNKT